MEILNNQEQIDSKYLIVEKVGAGFTSNVFLVKEIKTNEEYVAKVFKEKNKFLSDKEINILNILKQENNPYIVKIIDSGEGNVIRKNRQTKKSRYCILEYEPYGNIFDFIYFKKSGFGELFGKIIFLKIMKGIQFCHGHDICHRDIKLQNILLDKNFSPKICDFGFACINAPNLTDVLGTKGYKPPEIAPNKPYDGKKADIFSLGASLILLVTGKDGFKTASTNDKFYNKILLKHLSLYWKIIESINKGITLSQEFKDLYIKMVTYNPNSRPNAEDILNHPWFNDIKEIENNEEKMEELENKLKEYLMNLVDIVKGNLKKVMEVKNTESDMVSSGIKSTKMGKSFFEFKIKPKYIDTPMIMNNCIKIKGDLNPVIFMNSLCDKLIKKFDGNNCFIEADKRKLKFNIIFNEDEEEEYDEEEITEEMREELEKLGIDNENNEDEEENNNDNLMIQIKLYQCSEGHILRFIHKNGERKNFLDKFFVISKLVKILIS